MANDASIEKALSHVISCSTATETNNIASKNGSDDLLKEHKVYAIRITGPPKSIVGALDPAELELPHLAATLVLLHNGLEGLARLISHGAGADEFSCKINDSD